MFPSLERRGGCAIKKTLRSLLMKAQTGWSVPDNVLTSRCTTVTTPSASLRRLRAFLLLAQPPLLFQEGNTLSRQFVHILYDRRYSENIYWWNRPTMIAFPRMCPSIALKAAMRVFAASCGVAAGTSSFISNA